MAFLSVDFTYSNIFIAFSFQFPSPFEYYMFYVVVCLCTSLHVLYLCIVNSVEYTMCNVDKLNLFYKFLHQTLSIFYLTLVQHYYFMIHGKFQSKDLNLISKKPIEKMKTNEKKCIKFSATSKSKPHDSYKACVLCSV